MKIQTKKRIASFMHISLFGILLIVISRNTQGIIKWSLIFLLVAYTLSGTLEEECRISELKKEILNPIYR